MKIIRTSTVTKAVSRLCIEANINLRKDVLAALKSACRRETNPRAKNFIRDIIKNASIAKRNNIAICQDTGLPVVFLEIGQGIQFTGVDLNKAVQKGIEAGYKKAGLRNSIVTDPVCRKGKQVFSPGIIHTDLVSGSRLKITVLPKGFGCENKSRLKMFNPTVDIAEIKEFIVAAVRDAGPDACPPYIVGVGIGGTADYACLLAKKALLKKVTSYELPVTSYESKLEKDLLKEINKLNIGPMGLGGKITALAVNIETQPTHIAGLPVAVNISCHALRSAAALL
ncbi:MAG: fumarate hydratase [Candidatus Omnitrophica bacterium]|nr:fumarate hydratase [Candidatus Omnitrophota bacterium]